MVAGHTMLTVLAALVIMAPSAFVASLPVHPPTCICTQEYNPQCGKDGKTYGNACMARCAHVMIDYPGECKPSCICTKEYNPQCGKDGKTYGNPCAAKCAHVDIDYPGECKKPCICTQEYNPQCGKDGKTYGNPCMAKCANVYIAYPGKCKKPCICPAIYRPVCGKNGKTYSNSCRAACAHVAVEFPGSCEDCWKKCPKARYPVCGSDGNTYRNACVAKKCAGVRVKWTGKCSDLPGIVCKRGSAVAKCENPCDKPNPCKYRKNVVCLVNSCSKPKLYLGYDISSVGLCGAVYVNTKTGEVVKKCLKP